MTLIKRNVMCNTNYHFVLSCDKLREFVEVKEWVSDPTKFETCLSAGGTAQIFCLCYAVLYLYLRLYFPHTATT